MLHRVEIATSVTANRESERIAMDGGSMRHLSKGEAFCVPKHNYLAHDGIFKF